jgi:outer membrane protein
MKLILALLVTLLSIYTGFSQQANKKWSIEKCVDFAIKNNINVKQSELRSKLQEVEVNRSKMNFYPSVSATAGANYSFGDPINNNTFNNNYGISSNIVLYNGYRNKNILKKSKKDCEINELNSKKIQDDITLRVVNAYLNILYNRERVRIAQDQVKVGENLVKKMQDLVDAGTKARNDLFQIEANLATNEEHLVTAENNLDLSLLDLAQILQISHKGFDVKDVQVNIKTAKLFYNDSEIIYTKALSWRPEIESAKLNIENTEIDYTIAKSSIYPTVSASYRFGSNYLNVQDILNQSSYFKQLADNRGHSVGVSVNIPIFDKYNSKYNMQRAKIQNEIASYSLENEKTNLRAIVERAFIDAKTSLKTFEAAKKSVEAQEEAFRTAKERYDIGVLTSYDFDQVRNQLVNAQSSFIQAKYNFIFRSKFLEFYYGIPIKL